MGEEGPFIPREGERIPGVWIGNANAYATLRHSSFHSVLQWRSQEPYLTWAPPVRKQPNSLPANLIRLILPAGCFEVDDLFGPRVPLMT